MFINSVAKVKRVYKQAKNDLQFKQGYLAVRGNKFPLIPSTSDRGVIAACYCGWMIGKLGPGLAQDIYDAI